MQFRFALVLASAPLALGACAGQADTAPATLSDLGVPGGYSVPADPQRSATLAAWWRSFDDPLLADLVERGRLANLDVRQAATRVRQARESLVQARSALFPSVGASGGYARGVNVRGAPGVGRDDFSVGADASYQVDLFGGVASDVASARASAQGAGFDYATVLVSVEAEIARNYVLARLAQAQLANARASLGIQDENLEIAGFRVQAGLVSSLDAEQARVQRAQTAASIPSLEASYNSAVSRLGVLLGEAPGALKPELAAARPIPTGPASVATGIPADTLRQRPDILSAERSLAVATANIGVARAQLFPALGIGGSISAGAGAIDSVFDVITGRLFANIAQTIFDAGRNRSVVRSSQAAAEGAFLGYKQTVLIAIEDVENAIVALRTAQARGRKFATALDAANNSAILSRSQYRSGLTDFTTLNTAESALLSARNGLSQARADEATALIQLFTALGGGWTVADIPAPAPISLTSETR